MLGIMRAPCYEGIPARGESAKISFAPIHMRFAIARAIEISICRNFPRVLPSIRESRRNVRRREARNLGRNVEWFGGGRVLCQGEPLVRNGNMRLV